MYSHKSNLLVSSRLGGYSRPPGESAYESAACSQLDSQHIGLIHWHVFNDKGGGVVLTVSNQGSLIPRIAQERHADPDNPGGRTIHDGQEPVVPVASGKGSQFANLAHWKRDGFIPDAGNALDHIGRRVLEDALWMGAIHEEW